MDAHIASWSRPGSTRKVHSVCVGRYDRPSGLLPELIGFLPSLAGTLEYGTKAPSPPVVNVKLEIMVYFSLVVKHSFVDRFWTATSALGF